MAVIVQDIINLMEALAPPTWAENDDPVGLQVGRPDQEVSTLLLALELSESVLARAAQESAEMILVHHPFLFHPLDQVRTDEPCGRLLARLLSAGRSLYAAHTNLDAAPQIGPAAVWAARLSLVEPRPLLPRPAPPKVKIVTFLPADAVAPLRQALAEVGAGISGAPRELPFQVVGPAEADTGRPEVRLELVCPAHLECEVVAALRRAHPYPQPVLDLYSLRPEPSVAGFGRVGTLPAPLSVEELAELVKQVAGCPRVRLAGGGQVHTVAVLPGSGKTGLEPARAAGAEAFVTGEIDYHRAREAAQRGLSVLAAGHAETEAIMLPQCAEVLGGHLGDQVRMRVELPPPLWQFR